MYACTYCTDCTDCGDITQNDLRFIGMTPFIVCKALTVTSFLIVGKLEG